MRGNNIMNTKKIICYILAFTIIFAFTANVSAEDVRWKIYLKNFLTRNFLSLFNEKSDEIAEDIFIEFDGNIWNVWGYEFYDIDGDAVPEVIIYCGGIMGLGCIYKLYGTSYDFIGSIGAGEWAGRLYINTQGKIAYIYTFGVQFVEIKNKEIIYSPYIDSHGNDLSKTFLPWDLAENEFIPLPEFDCSDVITSIKTGTSLNPQTGGESIEIFFAIFILNLAGFILIKKFLKRRII